MFWNLFGKLVAPQVLGNGFQVMAEKASPVFSGTISNTVKVVGMEARRSGTVPKSFYFDSMGLVE